MELSLQKVGHIGYWRYLQQDNMFPIESLAGFDACTFLLEYERGTQFFEVAALGRNWTQHQLVFQFSGSSKEFQHVADCIFIVTWSVPVNI